MIVTVTMNPAIDKTVEIEHLEQGGLNRISRAVQDAGGKGINVSKTIRELGGESVAVGFLAGSAGAVIEKVLKEKGIRTDFIFTEGETRTNLKVIEKSGAVTEFNEPGPAPREAAVREILEKLDRYADEETLFVFSGSIPAGMSRDIYSTMIERVHKKGAKALLDADGDLFVNGLKAGPEIIKPNRTELESYFGISHSASEEELKRMGQKLAKEGTGLVALSLGSAGAMFFKGDDSVRCPGLKVRAHSTVGAGDAMVAALACSYDRKLDFESTVKLCVAVSAGAVTTVGTKPPERGLVEELLKQVTIIRL